MKECWFFIDHLFKKVCVFCFLSSMETPRCSLVLFVLWGLLDVEFWQSQTLVKCQISRSRLKCQTKQKSSSSQLFSYHYSECFDRTDHLCSLVWKYCVFLLSVRVTISRVHMFEYLDKSLTSKTRSVSDSQLNAVLGWRNVCVFMLMIINTLHAVSYFMFHYCKVTQHNLSSDDDLQSL